VSESRDFQLFTRVLDFVQNSLKYDIDSILDILSSDTISEEYVDYLKSKVGFFTNKYYDDETLRKILSAMPYIIRYKGSETGISMCINTFLNIMGYRRKHTISIYTGHDEYNYTIRVGIEGSAINTDILNDMLSYVIPTGYMVEFYFYVSTESPNNEHTINSAPQVLNPSDYLIISGVRGPEDPFKDDTEKDTYGTVQLSTVAKPDLSNVDDSACIGKGILGVMKLGNNIEGENTTDE
jgi:hypothetical protein